VSNQNIEPVFTTDQAGLTHNLVEPTMPDLSHAGFLLPPDSHY